jgi:hypothetical protein
MELSLKNFRSELPAEMVRKAEKASTRECDILKKGEYVAYVDERNESFDVSLSVTDSGIISKSSCDCSKKQGICRHQVALMIHLTKETKKQSPSKRKKKLSESAAVLEPIDPIELKDWLADVLENSKDLKLAFMLRFTSAQEYTSETIVELTENAVRLIEKNISNMDAAKQKRIISLWTDIHRSAVEKYLQNPSEKDPFDLVFSLLQTCNRYQDARGGKGIEKYIVTIFNGCITCVNNLQDEEIWEQSVTLWSAYIARVNHYFGSRYLFNFLQLYETSGDSRKKKLALIVANHFTRSKKPGADYARFVFKLVDENSMFEEWFSKFSLLSDDIEFNKFYISALIRIGQTDLAENLAFSQIRTNSYRADNITYYLLMGEVYKRTGDEKKLGGVLLQTVPYTFDFDDYLIAIKYLPDEQKQKSFRGHLISSARNHHHPTGSKNHEFLFRITDYEKKYKKMIDYIHDRTPYSLITKYFEPMFLTDKAALLEAMLRKRDYEGWLYTKEQDESDKQRFAELNELFRKHYTEPYLKLILKHAQKEWYHGLNSFMRFVERNINQ